MAYSDYLAVKKRKKSNISQLSPTYTHSYHQYLQNQQYQYLKNTTKIDDDGEMLASTRFSIPLSGQVYYNKNNTLNSGYMDMYSLPRIHVPEYIKKRYQPEFCWTCFTPLGEILNKIPCSICENTPSAEAIEEISNGINNANMSVCNILSETVSEISNGITVTEISNGINPSVCINDIITQFENSEYF
jgi:hypothetical protein